MVNFHILALDKFSEYNIFVPLQGYGLNLMSVIFTKKDQGFMVIWSLLKIWTFTYNINTCLQQNVLISIISYTTMLGEPKIFDKIYTMSKINHFELLQKNESY